MADSDKSFTYEIKTTADLEQVKAYKKVLEEVEKQEKSLGAETEHLQSKIAIVDSAIASATANLQKHAAALGSVQANFHRQAGLATPPPSLGTLSYPQVQGPTPSFQVAPQSASSGGAGIAGIAAGTALGGLAVQAGEKALEGIKDGLENVIDAYAHAEEQVNRLNAALGQQGNYSREYSAQLQELARSMQRAAGESTDKWLNVLARLSEFGADSSNIGRYSESVKNLAGIYGSTETAVTAFTKAMEGNFQTFAKHGIYVDGNTQLEKMESLMTQLANRGGGILESRMKGVNGQFEAMKGNLNDVMVGLGRAITQNSLFHESMGVLNLVLETWGENLRGGTINVDGFRNANIKSSEAVHSHAESSKHLKDELHALKDAAKLSAEQFKVLEEAVRESAHAQDGVFGKKEAKEIADIKLMAAQHVITKEQELEMIARIEDKYERQRTARRIAANNLEVKIQEEHLNRQINKQTILEEELSGGKRRKDTDKKTLDQQQRENKANEDLRLAQENLAKMQEQYNKAPEFSGERAGLQYSINEQASHIPKLQKIAEYESARTDHRKIDLELDAEKIKSLEDELKLERQITEEVRLRTFAAGEKAKIENKALGEEQKLSTATRLENVKAAEFSDKEAIAKSKAPNIGKDGTFHLKPGPGERQGYQNLTPETGATGPIVVPRPAVAPYRRPVGRPDGPGWTAPQEYVDPMTGIPSGHSSPPETDRSSTNYDWGASYNRLRAGMTPVDKAGDDAVHAFEIKQAAQDAYEASGKKDQAALDAFNAAKKQYEKMTEVWRKAKSQMENHRD